MHDITTHPPFEFEEELRLEREHDEAERNAVKEIRWLASFPEAIPRVKELIVEKSQQIEQLERDYRAKVTQVHQAAEGDLTTYFRASLVKSVYVPRILALKKDRARLQRELLKIQPPTRKTEAVILDVEHAKEVSLSDIVGEFTDVIKQSGRQTLTIRCPFHEPDHHPSCVIFTATNSFCCFACGVKGDVITFVEKALGYEFRDAVQWLERRSV